MKYKIWDRKEDLITPSGKIFTPEEWIQKFPVAAKVDTVISGGVINGSMFAIFEQMKQDYESQGIDFSKCKTNQDVLNKIEEIENERANTPAEPVVTDQTRIADALEDLVVLQLADAM